MPQAAQTRDTHTLPPHSIFRNLDFETFFEERTASALEAKPEKPGQLGQSKLPLRLGKSSILIGSFSSIIKAVLIMLFWASKPLFPTCQTYAHLSLSPSHRRKKEWYKIHLTTALVSLKSAPIGTARWGQSFIRKCIDTSGKTTFAILAAICDNPRMLDTAETPEQFAKIVRLGTRFPSPLAIVMDVYIHDNPTGGQHAVVDYVAFWSRVNQQLTTSSEVRYFAKYPTSWRTATGENIYGIYGSGITAGIRPSLDF
ncbi:hypothetical protein FB45DRAFT_882940 [Roridomyces roridus]|uniref:Uncharacterized protein n=1 Tax=Roridomyces roridus TaxID=1738132 RepID=A0AAD7AX23_9AGAR|nr:hypothetical protein FB45DRAFT_882940 [Roridomyces roridus]